MATAWLSKILSANPNLMKCFHSSVGVFPTYQPNRTLDEVMPAINEWALKNSVTYSGCVHLSRMHGVAARPYCLEHDIHFCGLVRQPILAIESQYYEKRSLNYSESFIAHPVFKWASNIPSLEHLLTDLTEEKLVFLKCNVYNLKFSIELEFIPEPVFKFEEYTIDYEVVRKILECITRGAIDHDPIIFEAFQNVGKLNTHRKKPRSVQETWERSWSDWQRDIFSSLWRYYYGKKEPSFYPEISTLLTLWPLIG